MKVLVTGAAGFIGSHVAERLAARGDTVIGLDNFDPFYDRRTKEQNLVAAGPLASFVEGDILDESLVDRLLSEHRFDVVVHLAALAGVRPSLARPARYQRVNVEGTTIVAEACIQHGVSRLVFASSSSVYGGNTKVPFEETDRVDAPVSPYAASKRAGELVLSALHHTSGLSVTALRYFTVYGPRQRPEMAIHAFCRAIDRGETITMFGGGESSRDYTYVDDVVHGTIAAVDRDSKAFSIYNLGGHRTTRLDALVAIIAAELGKEARVLRGPEMPGDVPLTFASVTAAGADLGYAPKTSIEEGVARFVEWYRKHRGAT